MRSGEVGVARPLICGWRSTTARGVRLVELRRRGRQRDEVVASRFRVTVRRGRCSPQVAPPAQRAAPEDVPGRSPVVRRSISSRGGPSQCGDYRIWNASASRVHRRLDQRCPVTGCRVLCVDAASVGTPFDALYAISNGPPGRSWLQGWRSPSHLRRDVPPSGVLDGTAISTWPTIRGGGAAKRSPGSRSRPVMWWRR